MPGLSNLSNAIRHLPSDVEIGFWEPGQSSAFAHWTQAKAGAHPLVWLIHHEAAMGFAHGEIRLSDQMVKLILKLLFLGLLHQRIGSCFVKMSSLYGLMAIRAVEIFYSENRGSECQGLVCPQVLASWRLWRRPKASRETDDAKEGELGGRGAWASVCLQCSCWVPWGLGMPPVTSGFSFLTSEIGGSVEMSLFLVVWHTLLASHHRKLKTWVCNTFPLASSVIHHHPEQMRTLPKAVRCYRC